MQSISYEVISFDTFTSNIFSSDAPEREGGTQQPASVCDVEYYGLTSPVEGSVVHPEPHRLFAMEGPVKCRQHFIPAPNQSVVITVSSPDEMSNLYHTFNWPPGIKSL